MLKRGRRKSFALIFMNPKMMKRKDRMISLSSLVENKDDAGFAH